MRDREPTDTLVGTLRGVWQEIRSDESREMAKMLGRVMFAIVVRVPLAFALHPVAMTRASFMIGNEETQKRDWETATKLPKLPFPRGGQRLK